MEDDLQQIRDYYDKEVLGEESRLANHPLERDITRKHLETHLPSTGRVLEIGAATGAYTVWLAERGYDVTAVELSENQMNRCRERLQEHGLEKKVRCRVADARDLSSVSESEFDAVLMMGPFYHLRQEADRNQALHEAVGCLKRGGVFVSSWISRFGIMGIVMRCTPEWIEMKTEVRALMDLGYELEIPKGKFCGYFARVDEVAPFHEAADLQTLLMAGVEPAVSGYDESYKSLEGVQRRLWFDLLFELSSEPSMVASSPHLLYVGRRP